MELADLRIDEEWTLFLDRDGTINKLLVDDYVKSWEEFEFLPGAIEAISLCSKVFGKVVVVTNQQGIGKGLMTKKALEEIHRNMLSEVETGGGKIDGVFYCPDLRGKEVTCRKPNTFMGYQAQNKFRSINFKKSVMIGDSWTDMRFGKSLYMTTVFIGDDNHSLIDFRFDSLAEFAESLQRTFSRS